ncbi:MAG: PQQ-dependent sugar dehydrogenase, partial [Bacteroidota bacterium]
MDLKKLGLTVLMAISMLTKAMSANLPEGFIEQRLAENLNPTALALAPDGRVFITEKNGTVRVVKDGVLQEEPFIELEVDDFNERGLSGITFHPNFDLNNYIYFFYTAPEIDANVVVRVIANGDVALPNSLEVIIELDPMTGSIHNGGALAFGPDGKLYIAAGEGGLPENSSNLENTLGSILRLNDDGSIPEDNPLIDQTTGKNQAIYAYGF